MALSVCMFVGCGGGGDETAEQTSPRIDREASISNSIEESRSYLRQYDDSDDVLKTGMAEAAALRAVDPDSTVPALVQLARVRISQNYFDEAVTLLSAALNQSPYHIEAWSLMGDAFLASGHYRSADSCYHVMYEMDDGFESLRRIALWKERFGDFDEALATIDQAIDAAGDWASDRDVARLYADLAAMFYAHGFVDEAIDNVDRSLELLPGAVPRIALRADMLRVKGLTAESDKIFESLPNLSPNPFYKTLLARVHTRRGEKAEADLLVAAALDNYDKLSLKYFSVIARRYVEFLLEFNIDPAKALKIAYGQSRKRRDMYSYELLAWAYYKNQNYDLAWSSIGLALRRKATDPRVVYRASVIAKAAGRADKHRLFSERARDMNPLAEEIYGP